MSGSFLPPIGLGNEDNMVDDVNSDVTPGEEEQDLDRESGGGILSQGGSAVDRGTGTMSGEAQTHGRDDDDRDDSGLLPNLADTDDDTTA